MFKDRYPVFFSGPKTLRFTLCVLGFIVLALLVQFPSTTRFNPLTHTSVILFSSLCTASALAAHSYAPGMLWSAAGLAGLYTLTAYAKLPLSMPLRGPEIVDAFALGTVAFSFASLFCVYAEAAQRSVLRLPFRCAAALARIAIVVPPAIFHRLFYPQPTSSVRADLAGTVPDKSGRGGQLPADSRAHSVPRGVLVHPCRMCNRVESKTSLHKDYTPKAFVDHHVLRGPFRLEGAP